MSEVFSRIPPHNLEAEMSLLGSMMIDPEAIAKAVEIVKEDDFFQGAHKSIYRALVSLYEQQKPCDAVTLSDALKSQGCLQEVGGVAYLSTLMNTPPTAANAEHYAEIVRKKSLMRRLIIVAGEIGKTAFDPQSTTEQALDEAEQKILALSHFKVTSPYSHIKDLVGDTFQRLASLYEHKQTVTGVPSGFDKLDEFTSGFQPSDLIIVAARPSMGKTAFCLNIAHYAAHAANQPTLIFSLEMSKGSLVQRILTSEARVDGQKVRSGYLGEADWGKLTLVAGHLESTPILIDDTAGATLMEIRSKARRAWAQEKIGLIVIDYLQLITMTGGSGAPESRQQEVSAISRGLKGLARELNVPVICLSQLSRQVESRTDKRPMLSDLRESGAIEQDADLVIFLYRDSYYNPNKEESRNKAEVIIAKQRNGPVGSCELAFFNEYAKFDNLDSVHMPD